MIGRLLFSFALFALVSACTGACLAADEGRKEAEDQLQKYLDEANAFYKTEETDGGKRFVVLMEDDDGSTKVTIIVEEIGSIGDTPVYGYQAFSVAATVAEGETFPPDVIKLVGSANTKRALGHFGITDDMSIIVTFVNGTMDGASARSLKWATFFVHRNRVLIRKEIQRILSERSE